MQIDPAALDSAAPLLFEANPLPILVYDRATLAILAVNEAATATYGYTRAEFLGMSLYDIRPPEDRPAVERWVREQEAMPARRTRRHLRKDGTIVEMEIATSIAIVFGGRSARLAIGLDVTERNRDLERLLAYGQTLEEAQELARLAVFQFDPRARRFSFAGISREVFGRSELGYDDALAMLPEMYHPDDLAGARAFYAALGREEPLDREFRLIVRGEVRWFCGRARLVRNPDGTPASVIGVAFDVTESKNEDERLRTIAFTDPETGLRNRASLFESGGPPVGDVGMLLLVHLAPIAAASHRTHARRGRRAAAVANRLRSLVPGGAVLARYSDDVYAIALGSDARGSALLADRVVAAFAKPLPVSADEDLVVVPTVGIAACPRAGLAELARRAEAALEEARGGHRPIAFYTGELERRQTRRATIDRRLPQAVEHGALGVVYQPIVDAGNGRIVAAEALMRWRCDELGAVPAEEFIGAAEASGAIVRLGDWMLREACREVARWDARGLAIPRVAVNVSAREMLQPGFLALVEDACAEAGIAPSRLELEITERALLDRDGAALRNVAALRERGVRIAIDDFGTGYSATAHVAALPFDTLKIDRSLVAPLASDDFYNAMALTIVRLAHLRELCVVAEGVEDARQLHELRSMGCDAIQGFFVGEPVAGDELVEVPAALA